MIPSPIEVLLWALLFVKTKANYVLRYVVIFVQKYQLHPKAFQSGTPLVFMSFSWLMVVGILASIALFLSSNVTAQEQTSTTKVIDVTKTKFSIQYSNTGDVKILSVKPDIQAKSLVINTQATKDGFLTVTLPRELIDDKDHSGADSSFFFVIGGYISGDAIENSKTPTQRTITIPFIEGNHVIVITGTQIVPEFGPLAEMVILISIMSLVIMSRIFFKSRCFQNSSMR